LIVNLRDAYLTYQAEIGTEEVVLPHPWIRVATEIKNQMPGFISTLRENVPPIVPRTVAPEPLRASLAPLPDFKSLDAYWKYLEEEYPKWFTSTLRLAQGGAPLSDRLSSIPLARAEGITNPVLAVVELAPLTSPAPKIFDGEPGLLLDKMMKAIHLDRNRLYLTSVMKTPAPGKAWARKDIARMLPCLFRELKLAACTTVLLLGEACAQAVLRTGRNLEGLRQQAVESEGLVFAASFHPVDLNDKQELKKKAWEDLKWLRMRLETREAG
jgi:uracil-DNA glycosylase